jgi:uridine monophosphate synthetase
MTPGVKLAEGGDDLGQQYNSPDYVIGSKDTDVIIVGRGICEAADVVEEARRYQEAGWAAHVRAISAAV